MSVPTTGSHSCVVNPRLKDAQKGSLTLEGKYGRMFPDLPALEADEDSAIALGRAASHMDGTLPVFDSRLDNPRIPAGFAILGQFVAHDITADRFLLAPHESVEDLRNSRVPRLDLECLYGDGPVGTVPRAEPLPSPVDTPALSVLTSWYLVVWPKTGTVTNAQSVPRF
jgi:hypothetical protein